MLENQHQQSTYVHCTCRKVTQVWVLVLKLMARMLICQLYFALTCFHILSNSLIEATNRKSMAKCLHCSWRSATASTKFDFPMIFCFGYSYSSSWGGGDCLCFKRGRVGQYRGKALARQSMTENYWQQVYSLNIFKWDMTPGCTVNFFFQILGDAWGRKYENVQHLD